MPVILVLAVLASVGRAQHGPVKAEVLPAAHVTEGVPQLPIFEMPPQVAPGVPSTDGTCGNPGCEGPGDGPMHSVHLFQGEFHLEATDLRVAGRGLDFVWTRKYRSRHAPVADMGHGWDFSYGMRIELLGQDLLLRDGNGRHDRFVRQFDGTWSCDGFFVQGALSGGAHVFTFPDGGTWTFRPFTGDAADGRIAEIADRNGNTLTFAYDSAGLLVQVTDTLGRDYDIGHDAQGRITSLTDITGRQVVYAYYAPGDAGGSPGDLRSARSPVVSGTPTGNDFPQGTTTTYTYSAGTGDAERDHNLLTITDAKGQTYLVNVYSAEASPASPDYDRVMTQRWGMPDDRLDVTWDVPFGEPEIALRAIVNDRMGNVSEHDFDAQGRCVRVREYTGRAPDADAPTTTTANRPVGKLRPEDPDWFETRYEWNGQSLLTAVRRQEGNATELTWEVDLDPLAPVRSRGNLRAVRQVQGTHGGGGAQSELTWLYDYATGLGSCCGTDFVSQEIDPRGGVTTHSYDARGNRLHTQHPVAGVVEDWEYDGFGRVTRHVHPGNGSGVRSEDVFTYYGPGDGAQNGYLKQEIADAGNLALAETFEYDALGRVVRLVNPSGGDALTTWNALDQRVSVQSPPVAEIAGVRYRTDFTWDANGNVVCVRTLDVDDSGGVAGDGFLDECYDYDILNEVVRVVQEVDSSRAVVTTHQYDANGNVTLTRLGEANACSTPTACQATNTVTLTHDERDFPFRETRAAGDAAQSTTQFDYDGNGNPVVVRAGIESPAPRVTFLVRDAFDRLVQVVDPMGNTTTSTHDANGNVVRVRVDGELLDQPGSGARVRLSETLTFFDAMDRRVREERLHFDPATQAPIGDGVALTTFEWSPASQRLRRVADDGGVTLTEYDSAMRPVRDTDARGNRVEYAYDARSNPVTVTEHEVSDLGGPDAVFVTTLTWDALDRPVKAVDNEGSVFERSYDSRDDILSETDALGNVVRHAYDGLRRRVRTERFLTSTGTGSGLPAGSIVTTLEWDDTSRLVAQVDGEGRVTRYVHDALNRRTGLLYADGSALTFEYDVHDNLVRSTDGNGTVVDHQHDLNDRVVRNLVVPGAGVSSDTLLEEFVYDGEGRMVRASDEDALVVRAFDSLGNLTRDVQNGLPVTVVHDGKGNRTTATYPGGRVLSATYDLLDRPVVMSDGAGTLATFDWVGPERRLLLREHRNGTAYAKTWDAVRRPLSARHEGPGRALLDLREFTWDRMSNKLARVHPQTPGASWEYGYDSVYRLRHSTSPVSSQATQYAYDDAGNRVAVTGGPGAGNYVMDGALPAPGDAQVNQYTLTPADARLYDGAGNLVQVTGLSGSGPQATLQWDYRSRLVRHDDSAAGTLTTYRHDPLGRRVEKRIEHYPQFGLPAVTVRWVYLGQDVCEERDGVGTLLASWIPGSDPLQPLSQTRGRQETFLHEDDLGNVVAATGAAGMLVERYEYDDFGAPTIVSAAGQVLASSAIGNTFLFSGARHDSESGLYLMGVRLYDPGPGRFVSRDPVGFWGDELHLGNGSTFAGNNPASIVDKDGAMSKRAERKVQRAERKAERQERRAGRKAERKQRREERKQRRQNSKLGKWWNKTCVKSFCKVHLAIAVAKLVVSVTKGVAKVAALLQSIPPLGVLYLVKLVVGTWRGVQKLLTTLQDCIDMCPEVGKLVIADLIQLAVWSFDVFGAAAPEAAPAAASGGEGGGGGGLNLRMLTASREATTRSRMTASAVQQAQRAVNEDSVDTAARVAGSESARAAARAAQEAGVPQDAAPESVIGSIKAMIAAVVAAMKG